MNAHTDTHLEFCDYEQVNFRVLRLQMKNLFVMHWGRWSRHKLPGCQIFCTENVVSSGVASNGSNFFVDDIALGSETLEAPGRAFTSIFLSSHEVVVGVPSFLEQPWIPFSSEMSFHGVGGL